MVELQVRKTMGKMKTLNIRGSPVAKKRGEGGRWKISGGGRGESCSHERGGFEFREDGKSTLESNLKTLKRGSLEFQPERVPQGRGG